MNIYDDETKRILARHFKPKRKSMGLTQEQMAERLKINPRSYIDLEKGRSLCSGRVLFLFLLMYDASKPEFAELLLEVDEGLAKLDEPKHATV